MVSELTGPLLCWAGGGLPRAGRWWVWLQGCGLVALHVCGFPWGDLLTTRPPCPGPLLGLLVWLGFAAHVEGPLDTPAMGATCGQTRVAEGLVTWLSAPSGT